MVGSNVNPLGSTTVVPPPASFITGGTTNMQRACLNRHGGRVTVSFKDGSAHSVTLRQLWDLRWNPTNTPQGANVTGVFPSH